MANLRNIARLNSVLAANKSRLAYINLDSTGTAYSGWISNFHIHKLSSPSVNLSLDLTKDDDLFTLFILASCWSRTGQFENATYFTVNLINYGKNNPLYWMNPSNVSLEKANRRIDAQNILSLYNDIRLPGRREISFRSDFYDGVAILANNWEGIKESLAESEREKDYSIFVKKMRSISGIGGSGANGKMSIKIPLILRELRVAGRYRDIPGEWCCVPDARVLQACKLPFFAINFKFPDNNGNWPLTNGCGLDNGITHVLNKSQILYSLFGDLYDIPLFAYYDLNKMGLI